MGEFALLEREGELSAIDAALGAAVAGEGGALVIGGAAGVGKTRLLAESRDLARGVGAEALSARAAELERDFPYGVVRQLVAPRLRTIPTAERESLFEGAGAARGVFGLGDDLGSLDTFAVLHALYWVVAGLAERSPLLLTVDDAHLADPASLDWLAFMLPRLEELPILLILARRTGEEESPGLARLVGDQIVEAIVPPPLSAAATATLIAGGLEREPESSFAAACHESTGGNPFLVTELVRELAAQGIEPSAESRESALVAAPPRVSQLVPARISRLSPDAAKLARAVAILGDGAESAPAAELAGLDPEAGREAADSLRKAGILDPGQALRFLHPLVRNAVYADIAPGERGQAHAAAAVLLRDRGAPSERIASQLLASEPGGDRAAVETLLEAGRRGLADGAPRSAVAYLTRALGEPPPPDLRTDVAEMLLLAGVRAADHAAVAVAEPDLRAALERRPAATRRLVVPLTTGMALGGRILEAAEVLQSAIQSAAAEGDVESAFAFEAQLWTLSTIFPGIPEVDLQQYVDEVAPDSPAGRRAAAIEARTALVNGSAREAAEAAERALANDCAIFEEDPELGSAMTTVLILNTADALDACKWAADRALEIARERNATPDLVRGLLLRGYAAWAFGDLVVAESDIRQAVELARLADLLPLRLMCAGPLAEVLIERDELEGVDAILAESGIANGPIPELGLFGLLMMVRAHLRFERGEFDAGLEDSGALSRLGNGGGFGPGPMVVGSPFVCRALVATGQVEKARELADTCLYYARRWGAPTTLSHVLLALAPTRGGAEEVRLLEEAVTTLGDVRRPLRRGHTLVELGAALRRQNRRAEARAPLREGLELARRCGAVRLANRAREELRATGETVRRYAPIGVESLTPSERRCAEMAASGMTNRQIAQSLFVTVKTVEAHLSAAYDKLDIGSRRELGEALRRSSTM